MDRCSPAAPPHPTPSAAVLPLRAAHPGDGETAANDVEALAAAEVTHARATLPERQDAVFDCYLGHLVGRIAPYTEANPIAILVSLIAAAGVHLGPGPRMSRSATTATPYSSGP